MHNYNVLIEKPVTETLQEALELQNIQKEHPQTVMVGHLLLYDQGYTELKKRLGMIGRVTNLGFTGLKSPVRGDMTSLEDWLPHPIYLFIDLLNEEPRGIVAKQTGDDVFHVDVQFNNNILGSIDIGWTWPERKREIMVSGTRGSLTLDSSMQIKTLSFKDKKAQKQQWEINAPQSALALEILEFVECITTGKQPKTALDQGVQVVKIIDLAKRSLSS